MDRPSPRVTGIGCHVKIGAFTHSLGRKTFFLVVRSGAEWVDTTARRDDGRHLARFEIKYKMHTIS
jgi:hypothetical protein